MVLMIDQGISSKNIVTRDSSPDMIRDGIERHRLLPCHGHVAMTFLHYEFDLSTSDSIEVTLDKQANVRLLDDVNFSLYKNGREHRYHGGLAKDSPVTLTPPRAGHWHVVIDLGGYAGRVRASARVLQGA